MPAFAPHPREEVRRLIGASAAGRTGPAAPSGAGDVVVDISRIRDLAAALTLAAAVRAEHEDEVRRRLEDALVSTAAALPSATSREDDDGRDDLRAAL
ncbi:hypothetical protein ACO2Q3_03835 [Caulobacter sp. KR2-114]|uniref:hypothetical protein n=1 Tax=Caulobacter sp. KR2-114 TaxID=3400912 RepID=UPI003C0D4F4E